MLRSALALAVLLAASAFSPAHAIVFTTNGPVATVANAPVKFTISASQLAGAQLGGYELTASYNSALLTFNTLTFSNALGDPNALEAIATFTPGSGAIDVAEVSLLPAASLAALQPSGGFALATLNFTALGAGTATLSLSKAVASDANGASIRVPEPASAVLCVSMLCALTLFRRHQA